MVSCAAIEFTEDRLALKDVRLYRNTICDVLDLWHLGLIHPPQALNSWSLSQHEEHEQTRHAPFHSRDVPDILGILVLVLVLVVVVVRTTVH